MPAYSEGKIFLDYEPSISNVRQHLIAAFDAASGSNLWKYNIGVDFTKFGGSNRFALSSSSVITMGNDGYLIAINKNTGLQSWKVRYTDTDAVNVTRVMGTTIVALDKIILENNGKIKIFDAESGALLRDIKPESGSYYPVNVVQDILIVTDGNKLVEFAAAPGIETTKPEITLDSIYPSRFSPYEVNRPTTKAIVWLSEESYTKMEVINSNNQVIKNIDLGLLKGGWNEPVWDGKDNQGRLTPYGKYYFAFELKDLAGNTGRYEFPGKTVAIGDVWGTTLKDVNLRLGPGTQYGIITIIPAGSGLPIIDEVNGWLKVTYQGSTTGYVAKYLLSTYSSPAPPTITTVTYIVQPGDTLSKIALKYGITAVDIVKANNIVNPNLLYIGQRLIIPVKVQPTPQIIHIVVLGDTLWLISRKYNVPIDTIMKNNNLTSTMLYIGQRLIIK